MQHIAKPTWSGLSTQGTLQVRRSVEQSSIACRVVIQQSCTSPFQIEPG